MPGLGLTEEHRALAEAVRGFAGHAGLAAQSRAAADDPDDRLPTVWPAYADQELPGLPLDAATLDVAVALEELGRALAPGPLLPTMLAAQAVRLLDAQDRTGELLTGLHDGSVSVAVSMAGSTLQGRREGEDVVLTGTADLLLGGAGVSHLLVAVELDGTTEWHLVEAAGLTLSSTPGIDPSRRVATALAEDVRITAATALGSTGERRVHESAAVLLSAEMLGVAAWCVSTAVDYAGVREQFGQPIGGFQAVKHRCADMLCRLEIARAAVWDAAEAVDEPDVDPDARQLAVCVAASLAPQTAVDCAKDLIQVLGGIGFTWEHDAHLYLKRALAGRAMLGGPQPWAAGAAVLARSGVRRTRSLELGDDVDAARQAVQDHLAGLDGLDDAARRRAIADAGYLVPHWPAPYGRGAGPAEQLVIDEEFRRAGVARPDLVIGNWALPTILEHGTEAQRDRFVPPTMHGEVSWCQMFSEPGAGSDLASLQTKAVRTEGGWLLSGQKVWTSTARTADWAICLARTSTEAKRQAGITYFLVDMRSSGLDVRPLRELTGEALFNEIFLSDVFVPDDCVVGEVGGGWRLARTTLANERVAMSGGSAFPSGVEDLLRALEASDREDPVAVADVGALVCLAQADAMLGVRATLARVSGTDPGAASSVRKLVGMHLRQDAAELGLELLGPHAVTAEGEAAGQLRRFLANRALTIAGGTSEVLHNVIGERILGLPRG